MSDYRRKLVAYRDIFEDANDDCRYKRKRTLSVCDTLRHYIKEKAMWVISVDTTENMQFQKL